mmetsp:Transcript_47031/g.56880  ORF Transcript_47031/g.56880 Transcript_47031/m.56880 type:complete len:393 (+) Transcript_47031:230-1408(+)|eukprot:CAMPEP_0172487376 /NCGR_PEP_ID=MMETSP1066-20121228/16454_1 /TAXON_ID=671091 /ORGANISM="Coscinodiscus wailesii, Strain CCMP2513" /LENGTH=392 /DNA_ID=CAMNT_0013253955 /DNA_START=259 /DNA_END=1437 /DNA_ORIENTATION=-
MAYNEESSGSGHDEPWIQWFCGLKGHEMFCEVERAYIEDGFNLYGLRASVPNFSDCLDLILDRIGPDDSDDSHLTQSACTLYGLIHARYIITAHGLDAMYNKYAAKEFGTCPLVQCLGQPVLPVGLKDEVGADTVKVFCPKCQSIYHPPPTRSRGGSGAVDGASFGTTFPHLFLMTFSNLVPDRLPPEAVYVPRVFGFRVHQSARQRAGLLAAAAAQAVNNTTSNNARRAASQVISFGAPPEVSIDAAARVATSGAVDNKKILSNANEKPISKPAKGQDAEQDKMSSFPQQQLPVDAGQPMKDADPTKIKQLQNSATDKAPDDDGSAIKNSLQTQPSSTKRKLKNSTAFGGVTGNASPAQVDGNGNGNGGDLGDNSWNNKLKRQKRPGNGIT